MKIKTFLALSGIISMGLLPLVGLAQTSPVEVPTIGPLDALKNIRNWLFTFLLIVAVIFFILAAYDFVTAGGNTEKVESARQKVIYGVIGLIVAIMAYGLVDFVLKNIGSTGAGYTPTITGPSL